MSSEPDFMRFTGDDRDAAEASFRRIEPKLRKFLKSYLRNYVATMDDVEDLSVVVLEKLWRRRRDIEMPSESAWWGYVAKTARNTALDFLRQPENQRPAYSLDDRDLEMIEAACETCDNLSDILDAADELWLRSDPADTRVERNRRLLAAQLHFLDRRPWREIVRLVSPHEEVSRAVLDDWLASAPVRRELAFGHLYRSNDELCRLLLSEAAGSDLGESAMEDAEAAVPSDGWSADEAAVIRARYGNGMGSDKIARLYPHLTPERIDEIVAACGPRLPFVAAARRLKRAFAATEPRDETVRSDGVWRRLVLQYFAIDDLPQKLVLERVGPGAECVDVKMNAGILNAWLSNGRIFSQLLRFIKGRSK